MRGQEVGLEGVGVRYPDGFRAVHPTDLLVRAGEFFSILGPSGCGKTTLLRVVSGFQEPSEGRVTIGGRDVAGVGPERRPTSLIFQNLALFPLMSVAENVAFGLEARGVRRRERLAWAEELLALVALDRQGGKRPSELSGGQRQRVAIARAIVRNPALLLLDEATSALDPQTEAAINATLARLSRGRTTISVTHRLASITGYDQIYVFDRGQIVEQGTHEVLLARHGLYAKLWGDQGGGLAAVPLLAGLAPDVLDALARRLFLERFAAGDLIIQEGNVGDKLYLIQGGTTEVLATDPAGRQRPVATLHEGDHFGEVALLYDLPRTASIRARTPVQLLSLSRADLGELLAAVPHLRALLERGILERMQGQGPVLAR